MIAIMIIILSVILFLIILLLTLPVQIEADSGDGSFQVSMPVFFSAGIFNLMDSPEMKIKILLIPVRLDSLIRGMKKKKKVNEDEHIKKNNGNHNKVKRPLKLFRSFMNCFKIRTLQCDIDTGNFPLNAQLVPLVTLVNDYNKNISINFENRIYIYFLIETRVINFLILFIKYKMSNLN